MKDMYDRLTVDIDEVIDNLKAQIALLQDSKHYRELERKRAKIIVEEKVEDDSQ